MELEQVQHLVWWAKDRVRGFMTGLHRSPDFGFSLDFAQHRAYVPGDAPKFIDWSVLARQDKVLTKQYEAESNLRAYFVLDSSSSLLVERDGESKWSYAISLLALIATILQKQRDALGLMEFNEAAHHFFEAKNTSEQITSILHHVKGKQIGQRSNADFKEVFDELLSRIPSRSQIVLFLDVFEMNLDAIESALSRARSSNHQVILITLDDSHERETVHFSGKDVIDSETGQRLFFTEEMHQQYLAFQDRQFAAMQTLCGQLGCYYYRLDIRDDIMVSLSKLFTT